ncbi:hypothetical protein V8F33_013335 [Rhypophila sp. PSN 637]
MKNMFASIRQALRDYKVGRALRKRNMTAGNSPEGVEDQVHPTKTSSCRSSPGITHCREEQHDIPKATEAKKGWHRSENPDAEFPWRGEFLIDGESNWRGTWILEVDDLGALDWEIERVPKETGRGGTYVREMTRQWPFSSHGGRPVAGGQDDLMVHLGRP